MLQSTGSMARLPRRRERKSIQGCGALEETEVSSCARSPVREERWGQRGSPWLPPVRQGGLSLYPECHGNHWRVYQDSLSAGDCLWSAFMNEGLGETDPLEQGGRGRIDLPALLPSMLRHHVIPLLIFSIYLLVLPPKNLLSVHLGLCRCLFKRRLYWNISDQQLLCMDKHEWLQ